MSHGKFSLGIDFGSNSVRALIIDVCSGEELGTAAADYKSGDKGVLIDPKNHHVARQHPSDYLDGLENCVKSALKKARVKKGFRPEKIIGIGVDTTGSTPIPVADDMTPLANFAEFKNNLNAQAWMWKDHSSMEEAEKITAIAKKHRPQYLAKCGGIYSSEWFYSKLWHCLNVDEKVFNRAETWVEFADFIPAVLAGIKNPYQVKRGVCAAGHKAMYCKEWGGLPDADFLGLLDKRLVSLVPRLYSTAYTSDQIAGYLCKEWALKLGLKVGTPIAVGAFDAHMGGVGAGIGTGKLVKIIGTSTCDLMVAPNTAKLPDIPGVCGIVDGSVIPNYYGIEAGQSAVGDIFNWFVSKICCASHAKFEELTKEAEKLHPGESGLLALDWNNGNRTVLVDAKLTGLILGLTLHSSQAEIYRALIEATAFGAKKIIDRLEQYGVHIREIISCGGIAEKNSLFMQIYADIIDRPLKISASAQTCALGAAIFGAVAAGKKNGGYDKVESAQKNICAFKNKVYNPERKNTKVYSEIYQLYSELHDSFGLKEKSFNHYLVMKKLLEISNRMKRV